MKNKYLLPIIFILLISATKISLHRSLWNFKDHKRIEYDLSMNAFNEVNYLNQKNGVKVKADLVVKIKDSIYANILLENKRIIEKINDSITSYEEIKLNNDILFENYTYKGKVEGKVSEEATAIKDFGFPIVAAMGLGYFVYYVWKWVTTEIKPVLGEAQSTLIKLVDRVRMLDNDMIRLNTKLSMVLEHKAKLDKERRAEVANSTKGKKSCRCRDFHLLSLIAS